jgi:hypothetical protein
MTVVGRFVRLPVEIAQYLFNVGPREHLPCFLPRRFLDLVVALWVVLLQPSYVTHRCTCQAARHTRFNDVIHQELDHRSKCRVNSCRIVLTMIGATISAGDCSKPMRRSTQPSH